MFKKIFFYLFPFAFVMSCASKKDVYYFQDIDNSVLENSFKFLNIQPGDILDIQIIIFALVALHTFPYYCYHRIPLLFSDLRQDLLTSPPTIAFIFAGVR